MGVHLDVGDGCGAVGQTLVVHSGLIAVVLALPEPSDVHPPEGGVGARPEEGRQRLGILDARVASASILRICKVDTVRRRNGKASTREPALRTSRNCRPHNRYHECNRQPNSEPPGLSPVNHHGGTSSTNVAIRATQAATSARRTRAATTRLTSAR